MPLTPTSLIADVEARSLFIAFLDVLSDLEDSHFAVQGTHTCVITCVCCNFLPEHVRPFCRCLQRLQEVFFFIPFILKAPSASPNSAFCEFSYQAVLDLEASAQLSLFFLVAGLDVPQLLLQALFRCVNVGPGLRNQCVHLCSVPGMQPPLNVLQLGGILKPLKAQPTGVLMHFVLQPKQPFVFQPPFFLVLFLARKQFFNTQAVLLCLVLVSRSFSTRVCSVDS
ncbi:hypothetical protein HPB51_025361 [Rhipicephalus microplus]|uniref:Uncharacterized protein n=1 Tax=Rhipicephalus microplus TaxID=6941 RepID=A0A9J6E5I0_RHIMP|nr:hypothetical protein HPB51_025361 [Rhipicephalus microplus]